MTLLFWDASALAKQYSPEIGSEQVDLLFETVPAAAMATTVWGIVETYSILVRKLNDGRLDLPTFLHALSSLQLEVADYPDFIQLPVADETVLASVDLICKHKLNSTDAAILMTLIQFVEDQDDETTLVLVASDKRLLRAAESEGIATLNPESIPVGGLPAWLASLS